jgi:hypothetical protein
MAVGETGIVAAGMGPGEEDAAAGARSPAMAIGAEPAQVFVRLAGSGPLMLR